MHKKIVRSIAGLALSVLFSAPILAAEQPILRGHVPDAVAMFHLQPLDRLAPTQRLHIAFNLPLRNTAALDTLFQQLYSPASTNFHRWLTPGQFTERFGPSQEDYQAVLDFARSNNLTVTRPHPGRAIAGVDGSVADIERALHVRMFHYQHPTENRLFFAPDAEPTLDLKVPIQAISGLDNYEVPHSTLSQAARVNSLRAISAGAGSGTNGNLLGADFRAAYVPGVPLKGAGQVIGLVEDNGSGFPGAGGYNPGDVQLYENLTGAPNIPLIPVFQANPPGSPGLDNAEFSLDIEMVIAMAPGISNIVLYLPDGIVTDEEMYQEMADPTHGEARPNQISTSWSHDTSPASTNYLRQLAVQGQAFFKYSGDSGAWPTRTNDYPGFNYLTLVGGTDLSLNSSATAWASETVWSGSSGGYFIQSVPIPFYQQTVNMNLNNGYTQGRNVPDVAMAASGIEIIDSFQPTNGPRQTLQVVQNVGGTSASTPLWAAFTALVNEQAASHGKPPVGFINPAIYSIAQGSSYTNCFHDITYGNNTNSGSPTLYSAAPGYDLCTGWGSPTGQNLINALVGLSGPTYVEFNYTGSAQDGSFDRPFNTLAKGISAVPNSGTIFIIDGGSSSETMTISKPMTITAENGAATVGQ